MQIKRKHTKKNYAIKYGLLALILIGTCMLHGVVYPRADINGAESQVIAAASSTFYYDGAYYRAKASYINQLTNALDSQYDLNQSQANSCIDYIYNNVGSAIQAGYLYKVADAETIEDDDSQYGQVEIVDEDHPQNTGNPTIQTTQVVHIQKETAQKTKEETLKEATELASEMGVNIKFDNSEEGFTITDQTGNVLISTRDAVKNTGFRVNSLIIYAVLVVVSIIALVIAVKKLKLLEHDYGDEEAKTD